jgi:exopolysaccharide biosynthesis protein
MSLSRTELTSDQHGQAEPAHSHRCGRRRVYLLVVDGRSEQSLGMTLLELQAYVTGMGLTNAINLDGGGSSTLVLGGSVMNKPSDGRERRVPSLVEDGAPQPSCAHAFVRC